MNPLRIIKAEWRRSWQGILALSLILSLSVGLGLAISMVERGLRQGATRAGDAFDLLVGAPGSPTQLLLSAVYLQPQPLPLMPYPLLEEVAASAGVAWVAPVAFGDRWQHFPLVGTTETLVTLGNQRPLAEGNVFGTHEQAVVGASVPLAPGDVFSPVHGRVALPDGDQVHAHFTVTGRMPLTGTPWDRAILIPIEAVWKAHGLSKDAAGAGFSALIVKPQSVADAYKLRAAWQTQGTQAVFTGEVLTDLFATLGDMRAVMQSLAVVAQGIALAGVVLATVFAVALRRDTLSLLRTLGAPRAYLLLTIWSLAACIMLLGVLGGMGAGLLAAHAAASLFETATATALPVTLTLHEGALAGLFLLAGLGTALLPALTFYRRRASAD